MLDWRFDGGYPCCWTVCGVCLEEREDELLSCLLAYEKRGLTIFTDITPISFVEDLELDTLYGAIVQRVLEQFLQSIHLCLHF